LVVSDILFKNSNASEVKEKPQAQLIRINPEFSMCEDEALMNIPNAVISISDTALSSLHMIQKHMDEIESTSC